MTPERIGTGEGRPAPAVLGAAEGLCLAAAPTFAIMALLSGVVHGPQDLLCSAAPHAFPLNGMGSMYMLMSLFHSGPWLKLAARRRGRARVARSPGESRHSCHCRLSPRAVYPSRDNQRTHGE